MERHCGIVVDRSVSGVVPILSCSGDKYDLSSKPVIILSLDTIDS